MRPTAPHPKPGVHWYRDPNGDLFEAARWESGQIEYAGEIVGWLLAQGPEFRCEGDVAPNTLLVLTGVEGGTPVASTGDYVARRGTSWTVIPGEVFDRFATAVA